jgi:hypothetical protein
LTPKTNGIFRDCTGVVKEGNELSTMKETMNVQTVKDVERERVLRFGRVWVLGHLFHLKLKHGDCEVRTRLLAARLCSANGAS